METNTTKASEMLTETQSTAPATEWQTPTQTAGSGDEIAKGDSDDGHGTPNHASRDGKSGH